MEHPIRTLLYELFVLPIVNVWTWVFGAAN
jgi:hypothetical protein